VLGEKSRAYDLDLWIDIDADCTPDAIGQCEGIRHKSFVDNVNTSFIDNPPAGTYPAQSYFLGRPHV